MINIIRKIIRPFIKRAVKIWQLLGNSVYEGERGRQNLKTIAAISTIMEIPALIGVIKYFFTPLRSFALSCMVYFILNLAVIYLSVVKKDREAAVKAGVILALTVCTNIAFFARNGFAATWTLVFPLIISYLASVRLGILCSAYLTFLFMILYWTPLRFIVAEYGYTPIFLDRFPLLFLVTSLNTSYIMIEYHLNILKEFRYEKKLEAAKNAAEEANRAKSDFLANMSHELRTPLNAVLGMAELILRDCQKAVNTVRKNSKTSRNIEQIISYAGNIESAGNNLLSIINYILDFSKIESGKIEIASAKYRLSSVLNDLNMISLMANAKGLEFKIVADETLPDVYLGDEMRVRQIMQNILTNAVKYTEKGSVIFSIERADGKGFSNVISGDTVDLKITVQDTGIGIKKEDFEKIFKRFERTDAANDSGVEGTGLGLAIVQRLCGMMNGTIELESEYGKGSTFTVIIPQTVMFSEPLGDFSEKAEKNFLDPENDQDSFRAPEARILVVDDTKLNLTVFKGLLKDTEIKIDTASSGEEALILSAKNVYDIIFMDQRMPKMNGTETLQRIKKLPEKINFETPVICLTADAISGAKEKYISEGFNDYLTKPIVGETLEKILIAYLPADKVKFEAAENQEQEFVSDFEEDDIYKPVREAGINPEVGLKYCLNDEKFYMSVLSEYSQSAEEKISKLQKFFDAQDWENYSILIHSVKSTSRMIGAVELAEIAAGLEKNANGKDSGAVFNEHGKMKNLYKKTAEAIRSLCETENSEIILNDDDEEILEFFPEA